MAQAEHDTTENSAALHPVPSDAELVSLAFRRLHSLEDDMDAIGDFCNVITVGLALEVEEHHDQALGSAIHRIASEIEARHERVGEVHRELFYALNPNRHNPDLIPPGFTGDDDGNGDRRVRSAGFLLPVRSAHAALAWRPSFASRRSWLFGEPIGTVDALPSGRAVGQVARFSLHVNCHRNCHRTAEYEAG